MRLIGSANSWLCKGEAPLRQKPLATTCPPSFRPLPKLCPRFQYGVGSGLRREVWNYARERGFTLVTQDADFGEMSEVRGFPPKVIWIRRGNCSTGPIESILRRYREAIASLEKGATAGIFTVL